MAKINFIFENVNDAMEMCNSGCVTALPVEGGYLVTGWSDYYRLMREESESLYDGGWRANDPDCIERLIEEYCEEDNRITREWAEEIRGQLATIELRNLGGEGGIKK